MMLYPWYAGSVSARGRNGGVSYVKVETRNVIIKGFVKISWCYSRGVSEVSSDVTVGKLEWW